MSASSDARSEVASLKRLKHVAADREVAPIKPAASPRHSAVQRLVAAGPVLVGEAAIDGVAGVEGLALGVGGDDQPVVERRRW